jgi:phosphonate transport system substrate-binding protein
MLTCAAALFALLAAQHQAPPQTPPATSLSLNFGVYQSEKATEMYRSFIPVLDTLTASLETRLHRPVDIKLVIFKDYADGIDSLARGAVDFVRFGPASYVTAKKMQPDVQLIAMETEGGDKLFKGVIIVRKDSPIQRLTDLRGKKFAFGDPNSTIGRYLVQAMLVEAGITAKDLAEYRYLGRHDIVVSAVEIGDFDAGAVMKTAFDKANTKGTMRVLESFDNVTKPWVARKGLDKPVVDGIEASLCAIQDPAILKVLKISGFCATSDEEFQLVRDGMKLAEKFELPQSGQ